MLTEDILNENKLYLIPEATLDNEVAHFVQKLKDKGVSLDVEFDPLKHLVPLEVPKRYTFSELGIEKTHVKPLNEIAAADPFDLLTQEAIDIILLEVFLNRDLLTKCGRLVNLAKNATSLDFSISGFVLKTKFTHALFSSAEFINIINTIMNDDLEIPHEFSLGSINASLAKVGEVDDDDVDYEEIKRKQDQNEEEISSAVHWHYDSPPLVCVVMLSAPAKMVGGETGVRLGDESILRIPNSKAGKATLLQGKVVKHIAFKPVNNYDRISYVLSFIPKDHHRFDSTSALSERPGAFPSYTNDKFYPNFLNYRFDRIERRLRDYRTHLIQVKEQDGKFDQVKAIEFIHDIEKYLKQTYKEMEAYSDESYPPKLFSIPYKELVDV